MATAFNYIENFGKRSGYCGHLRHDFQTGTIKQIPRDGARCVIEGLAALCSSSQASTLSPQPSTLHPQPSAPTLHPPPSTSKVCPGSRPQGMDPAATTWGNAYPSCSQKRPAIQSSIPARAILNLCMHAVCRNDSEGRAFFCMYSQCEYTGSFCPVHRFTSLIRKSIPPRATIGPWA